MLVSLNLCVALVCLAVFYYQVGGFAVVEVTAKCEEVRCVRCQWINGEWVLIREVNKSLGTRSWPVD